MGLRDARLLRRMLPDPPAKGPREVASRTQVVVLVRPGPDDAPPAPEPAPRPSSDFGSTVGRMLDQAWGGEESEERLAIGTLPPRPAPKDEAPVRPPTRLLQGTWQHDLEHALDVLEEAEVTPAERARLSKDPGLVELKAILARGPMTDAQDQRATRRSKRGDVQGALDELTDAIEAHKTHPQPWTKRGIAHARAGDLQRAVADYTRALELDPEYLPAWANRGSANFHLDQHEDTVRDCTRAVELAPRLAQAWLFRGMARAKLGQATAGEDLYHFLQLCPYSPWVKLIRETLKQVENWDEDDSDEGPIEEPSQE